MLLGRLCYSLWAEGRSDLRLLVRVPRGVSACSYEYEYEYDYEYEYEYDDYDYDYEYDDEFDRGAY